jgi:excisionase family DNA binding protein
MRDQKRRRRRKPPSEQERDRRARQRAFSINEFCERNNVGKDKVYDEIRAGRLIARKAGKRTLILDSDEDTWRESLPRLELPA